MAKIVIGYRNRYTGDPSYVKERFATEQEMRRGNPKKYRYVTFKCFGNVYTLSETDFNMWYKRVVIRKEE